MGTVTWHMAPSLLVAPEALPDGSRFNASQGAARMVLALFGSVIVFGAIAVAIGTKQMATGTRPRRMVYVLWATGALIVAFVLLTVFAIKAGHG